tara:strand:- start:704 stop:853 length:150 start_codon:yes stop_codon:yes gene_type:complete
MDLKRDLRGGQNFLELPHLPEAHGALAEHLLLIHSLSEAVVVEKLTIEH